MDLDAIIATHRPDLRQFEEIYKDIQSHPELGRIRAERLRAGTEPLEYDKRKEYTSGPRIDVVEILIMDNGILLRDLVSEYR